MKMLEYLDGCTAFRLKQHGFYLYTIKWRQGV